MKTTEKMPIQGVTLWFTGLSGSGKTTIARQVERVLRANSCAVEVLDGDAVRAYLSPDLGFTRSERDINIRRIGFMASLLSRNGVVTIVAAISPYQATRNEVRALHENFVEVYVSAPLCVCEMRDVKGLYAKARSGKLKNFTGIDDPYEEPLQPEIICCTATETVEESVAKVLNELDRLGFVAQKQVMEQTAS